MWAYVNSADAAIRLIRSIKGTVAVGDAGCGSEAELVRLMTVANNDQQVDKRRLWVVSNNLMQIARTIISNDNRSPKPTNYPIGYRPNVQINPVEKNEHKMVMVQWR